MEAIKLLPGDTLMIRGGQYNEKIYLNTSGSSGNFIVITAYANEVVFVDGSGVTGLELLVIH